MSTRKRTMPQRCSALGSYLTHLRIENKFRQRDVAEKVGYASSMISLIESGRKLPSHAKIKQLSDLFGVSPSEFYQRIAA